MSFEPQVPDWGKKLAGNNFDQLITYHDWLYNTGIKTGLISKKSKQFIWDEFIIHSLYFAKIITELPGKINLISDWRLPGSKTIWRESDFLPFTQFFG